MARKHRICHNPSCKRGTYVQDAVLCSYCGAPLEEEAYLLVKEKYEPVHSDSHPTVHEEEHVEKHEGRGLWVAVGLFFLVVCLVLGYLLFNQYQTAAALKKIFAAQSSDPKVTETADPTKDTVDPAKNLDIATIAKDGKYTLHNFDNAEIVVDLSKAIGFTPDNKLMISDLKSETLGLETAPTTRDFQKYLNQKRDGFGPLAGYTDGTNDYNQYFNHQSAPQVPAYSWMIHTGEFIEIPGVGRVEGGVGRAVLVLIINRTDRVYRFPTNSVTVIAGFQGWGRIWNGESKEVVETEKRLSNHYLTRLGEGVPETGFIGQTDRGADNALTVTVVTVEMIKVGEFRLIRAETVPAIKK